MIVVQSVDVDDRSLLPFFYLTKVLQSQKKGKLIFWYFQRKNPLSVKKWNKTLITLYLSSMPKKKKKYQPGFCIYDGVEGDSLIQLHACIAVIVSHLFIKALSIDLNKLTEFWLHAWFVVRDTCWTYRNVGYSVMGCPVSFSD